MSLSDINSGSASARAFTLHRDARERLVLVDAEGREHAGVEPVRCFPISSAEQWIAICDAQGYELACVDDLGAVSPETRRMLEEELARNEFVPVVRRILSISDDSEYSEWQIETDRGRTCFRINGEDAVRRLDGQRVMIVDSGGIRYLIPDAAALDTASRRLLDRYV
jgi:hypothetical protein